MTLFVSWELLTGRITTKNEFYRRHFFIVAKCLPRHHTFFSLLVQRPSVLQQHLGLASEDSVATPLSKCFRHRCNVSDNAITALLKTFKVFLTQVQQYLHPCPQSISTSVLSSLIFKYFEIYCSTSRCVPFCKGLAACKKCFSVHAQYRTCIHQQGRSSKMCDEPLYQSGVRILRPLCTCSYVSLIESLQAILSRPNMVELCHLWQQHNSDPDLLCDVYDGLVWKELSMQYPSSLADHTLSLGLALNIDWFQTFQAYMLFCWDSLHVSFEYP